MNIIDNSLATFFMMSHYCANLHVTSKEFAFCEHQYGKKANLDQTKSMQRFYYWHWQSLAALASQHMAYEPLLCFLFYKMHHAS
jgi:hypothetical protein